jgi:transposase InsO family protein
MKPHGIKARSKREFVVTTDSQNLLARDFTPPAPDRVWSSDITYIATDEGWLYLVAVIDLFSRQVAGWSMQPHMQPGHACAAHGLVQTPSGAGLDLPFGPGQPILQPRHPGRAGQLWHAQLNEPKRQLLGQTYAGCLAIGRRRYVSVDSRPH